MFFNKQGSLKFEEMDYKIIWVRVMKDVVIIVCVGMDQGERMLEFSVN